MCSCFSYTQIPKQHLIINKAESWVENNENETPLTVIYTRKCVNVVSLSQNNILFFNFLKGRKNSIMSPLCWCIASITFLLNQGHFIVGSLFDNLHSH